MRISSSEKSGVYLFWLQLVCFQAPGTVRAKRGLGGWVSGLTPPSDQCRVAASTLQRNYRRKHAIGLIVHEELRSSVTTASIPLACFIANALV